MGEVAIKVSNLNKTFNSFKAVDSLDFQVERAECFGLLGPNGAGKTTSMKIIYGMTEPDKSKDTVINIFGFSPGSDALSIKALSGIVPQQDNLDIELNVTDNLLIYSKFYGIPAKEAKTRIEELLAFMELQEKAKAKVRELSGGMQRRLTIARALLNKPRLLILDEPTTGLDPQVRHLIWNKLRELKDKGVTILITTHYMEEAFQICDRIIIMDKGKKIIEGNPRQLLTDNLEKYVMEIYGACRDESLCLDFFKENGIRYEFFMDTLFAFCSDSSVLAKFGETLGNGDYHIRRSNLEDLFLKVTGRSLNELQ
ncbi:MAG: ATP-binding cassette domain-containing protein [Ruminiclostridium sp.]|nr:ATP-binding cassette domain-containing protein [Ruminiclostridium sp.]